MKNQYNYNQQPTLLIGLGGFGSRIVNDIYGQVKDNENVSAFSVDTNVYDQESLEYIPKTHIISIAQHQVISNGLSCLSDATKWFPNHPVLFQKTLSEGAGQVRAVARLCYELSLNQHRFDALLNEVNRLAIECIQSNCRMKVSIVCTLIGGTASGIFIQVALLIKEYLSKYFPALNVKIHGEFILPSTFLSLHYVPKVERRHLESNAYAALKELNAINEHFFSNTTSIQLNYGYDSENDYVEALPYDYCFLYDRISLAHSLSKQYIVNAIIERLFSTSANVLNDCFVENLRYHMRKRAGNLYGTIYSETLPLQSSILDSEIFRSIINRTSTHNGKKIFMVRTPKRLDVDTALFSQDTIYKEIIDSSATNITMIELCFGIELSEIEKMKYKSGQYYTSYHSLIEQLPRVVTPHLNKNWHIELHDIGESEEMVKTTINKTIKESFVFISYSSLEYDIASQVRQILETNGITCWMAPQSIPAGSDYGIEIPKAIEKCKVFLLLLSDASQKSNWVPKEIGLAIGKGKIVVPFQIDNTTISEAFNFYLTNSQRISAYQRMSEAYQELIIRLKDILR